MSGPQSHDLKMAPKTLSKARDSFCRLRTRQSTPSASRQNTNCVSRRHQWSRYQWDCQRRERRQGWRGMAVIVLILPNRLHCHIWEGDHSNSLVIGFRWIRPQARQSWPTEQIPACCGCTSSDPGGTTLSEVQWLNEKLGEILAQWCCCGVTCNLSSKHKDRATDNAIFK